MELKFKMKEGTKVLIDIADLDNSIQNLPFSEIILLFKDACGLDVMLMDTERFTKGKVNLKQYYIN